MPTSLQICAHHMGAARWSVWSTELKTLRVCIWSFRVLKELTDVLFDVVSATTEPRFTMRLQMHKPTHCLLSTSLSVHGLSQGWSQRGGETMPPIFNWVDFLRKKIGFVGTVFSRSVLWPQICQKYVGLAAPPFSATRFSRLRPWGSASGPRCKILGKSSKSVQCSMLKACDACADMGQL